MFDFILFIRHDPVGREANYEKWKMTLLKLHISLTSLTE